MVADGWFGATLEKCNAEFRKRGQTEKKSDSSPVFGIVVVNAESQAQQG